MRTRLPPEWTTPQAKVLSPCRRGDIVESEIDGEVILFNPRTGHTHRLNETAAAVWGRCDGLATSLQVAWQLVDAYDVELETAIDHVHQLMVVFVESELIES